MKEPEAVTSPATGAPKSGVTLLAQSTTAAIRLAGMPTRAYLAVHDYGMGGVWMLIDAPSAAAVREKYPELTVFDQPPADMDPDELAAIEREPHGSLEDPPVGYLAHLVDQRTAEGD